MSLERDNLMSDKDKQLFREKDKLRGLVPSAENGKADETYGAYLAAIEVETDYDVHLALAQSEDRRFRTFLEMIAKPGRNTSGRPATKLQTVAKQCGIDLLEFGNWYSKATTAIAIGKAQRRAANIVADMAEDALTQKEFCQRCDGMGWVAAAPDLPVETEGYRVLCMRTVKDEKGGDREEPVFCRTCPKCKGVKSTATPGDTHARDRVLEIAGVIVKGPKTALQITQNFGGAGHTSAVTGSLGAITVDVSADEEE